MKKLKLSPLELDKATIALLDANQLQDVVGGTNNLVGIISGGSTGCGSGSSTCSSGGSTGCGSGSSTCRAIAL